ncbi:hypothetical protein [Glaciecola sp. 33A]|uniref:hypothetical protein n=1 Tax=Glaciecola sp. 33A TaxID=2057807 RepID=UPI000C322E18|nr:hypothetical protein [Glaciecola sp. 33A]PKI01087.1 hypothetical protein CXF81_14315 [Glaciecola sp. 33A]
MFKNLNLAKLTTITLLCLLIPFSTANAQHTRDPSRLSLQSFLAIYACAISGHGAWMWESPSGAEHVRCSGPPSHAANLMPAMSNVSTRSQTQNSHFMLINVVYDDFDDYLVVSNPYGKVSLRKYSSSELQLIKPKLRDKTFSQHVGFIYKTDPSNVPAQDNIAEYLALINNQQIHPYVYTAPNLTAPIYAAGIPLMTFCNSFPSCLYKQEQLERWYMGNSLELGPQTATLAHNRLPDECNPFKDNFRPTHTVDGLIVAELHNDLRYLSDQNLQDIKDKGFNLEPLYELSFDKNWDVDPTIIRNNPKAPRKAIVQPTNGNDNTSISSLLKTEAYYSDLIQNKLIVKNLSAPNCKLTFPPKTIDDVRKNNKKKPVGRS